MVTSEEEHTPTSQNAAATGGALLLFSLLLLAFNLRPAATSVGPVLEEISEALAYTPVTAGLLTAVPVLMFGAFALLTPLFVRWFGLHLLALLSITITGAGLTARPFTDNGWIFLLLSAVGLSGLAVLNVILPSLVKRHFPDRIGMATALYTGSMSVGLSAGALLTYPIASMFAEEGWRIGLFVWGLTSLICIPFGILVVLKFPRARATVVAQTAVTLFQVGRTPLGWLLAIFFGLQSLQAYAIFGWFAQINRDAGFSASTASLLLSTVSIASIPAGFVAANLAGREHLRLRLILGLSVLYASGYIWMIFVGTSNWVWAAAIIIGIAQAAFPVVLALIGMKSLTVSGTASLSAFTQAVGYAIAAVGPFGMGMLHDATDGWTVPLIVLTTLTCIQAVVGWLAIRQPYLEEALGTTS